MSDGLEKSGESTAAPVTQTAEAAEAVAAIRTAQAAPSAPGSAKTSTTSGIKGGTAAAVAEQAKAPRGGSWALPARGGITGYAIAVAAALLALLVRQPLPITDRVTFLTFYPAVAITAWYGGLGPGLLATALSVGLANYFLLQPAGEWVLASTNLFEVGLFAAVSSFLAWVVSRARSAEGDASAAAREAVERGEQLRVTLAGIGDGVVATDATGHVTLFNPVAQTLTGWSEKDALGRPVGDVFKLISAHTRKPADNPLTRVLAEGTVVGLANHNALIAKDGTERAIADSGAPVRNASGEIIGAVLVFRDVTAERRTESDARAAADQLQLALEAGRMGSWTWDIKTNAITWSDSLEPLHGLAPGTFGGTFDAFLALVHPDDRETLTGHIQRAVAEVSGYDAELRVVWPDGSIHWMRGVGRVFPDAAGAPQRMMGIGTDITSLKDAVERQRLLADASRAFAEASLDIERVADEAARHISEAIGASCSIQLADSSGTQAGDRPVGEASEQPERAASEASEAANARDGGLSVPLRVGGRVIGRLHVSRDARDPANRAYSAGDLALIQELADRAAAAVAQARLFEVEHRERTNAQEAVTARNQFLSIASHELRTPVTALKGHAQMLLRAQKRGRLEESRLLEGLTNVNAGADRLNALIQDLLDVSRLTTGRLSLRAEPVDPVSLVREVVSRHAGHLAGNHRVSTKMAAGLGMVMADAGKVEQVLVNLLANAAKYSPTGTSIHISASAERAASLGTAFQAQSGEQETLARMGVRIEVRDSGIGLPPGAAETIFEPFGRATNAAHLPGMGLGLYISRGIIEQHSGKIGVHSEGEGRGSIFWFWLPSVETLPGAFG